MKTTRNEMVISGTTVTFEKTTASHRAPGQGKTFRTAQWVAFAADGRLLTDGNATRREAIANSIAALA